MTLRCLHKKMETHRHWSVSLWRDPDDVSHCRILSPEKTEWRLILATLCGWRRCFRGWPVMVHDTHTRRKEDQWHCSSHQLTCWRYVIIIVIGGGGISRHDSLWLGTSSRLDCPTLDDRPSIARKTTTTAFEAVCVWSVSPAPSFTMSQSLRATTNLSVVCLSVIFLYCKKPWLQTYKLLPPWPPERLAQPPCTSRHLARQLCTNTVRALAGGNVDRNDTCHPSPVNENARTPFPSSNFNQISQTNHRLSKKFQFNISSNR